MRITEARGGFESTTPPNSTAGPVARFVTWLDASPWSRWWLIPGLLLFQVGWAHAALWASGRLEVGAFESTAATLAVYGPYSLAAGWLGIRVGRDALLAFWPATGWPVEQQAEWLDRFAHAPVRHELAALLVGAAGGLLALVAAPDAVIGPAEGRLAVFVAYAPAFVFGYAGGVMGIVLVLRWLRLVGQIHREATAIDPFDRVPIYAFSRLTVMVGLAFAVAVYYSFTANASFQAGNLPSLAFLAATTTFSVLAFVAPLWGIHGRLVRAKEALLLDAERRLTRLEAELYARIDAADFAAATTLNGTLESVTMLRARVEHLPTWPWPPQLFRGFVSALLLPVVVYLLTRVASSFVGG
jgi:hypothetical protein